MTTPPTPQLQPVDPLVKLGHTIRDEAELVLTRYRIGLVLFVVLVVFAGWKAYEWHVEKLARLEAQATVLSATAANEHTMAETWKARALLRRDSVRVDSVAVERLVYRTPTFTVPVPMPQEDGTISAVPMPVVLRMDFDSLGGTCSRLARDCSAALAAKDSAAVHDSVVIETLYELNHNNAAQIASAKRATLWSKLLYGAAGVGLGFILRH